MEAWIQDLRYGIRMALKTRTMTLAAILTLGLGVGANLAVFTFVNALFLRPLGFDAPERLVRLFGKSNARRFDIFSYPNYADLRDRTRSLSGLAAHQAVTVSLGTGDQAEAVRGEIVSGNYFGLIGVRPALGRLLLPDDDLTPGGHSVVVLGQALFKRRFGARPDVVGNTIYLNGHPFTVVGIAPAWFRGAYESLQTEIWATIAMHEQVRPRGLPLTRRSWGWLQATGRLAEGVSLPEAQAEIDALSAQLAAEDPTQNRDLSFSLVPAGAIPEEMREGAGRLLTLTLVVVSLVVLAACANIASLMLVRLMARRRETAVRLALGVTRGRLVRQWLTESFLLSLAAVGVGLLLGQWLGDTLMTLRPPLAEWTSFSPELRLDGRVLGFSALTAIVTTLSFGLLPALRAGRADSATVLKDESTGTGPRRSRLHGLLVTGQLAVSLVLLVVAGLLLRSLGEIRAFQPGFDTRDLLVAEIDLRRHGYEGAKAQLFYRQLIERLKALAGVRAATLGTVVPLGSGEEIIGVQIEGHQPPEGQRYFSIDFNLVGSDYFTAMGIPILRGRGFEAPDAEVSAPVAVINDTMARLFWPGEDPIGRSLLLGPDRPPAKIVGVAADIKYYSLGESPRPYLYLSLSLAQRSGPPAIVHLRASGETGAALAALRREVAAVDPAVAVAGAMSFEDLRSLPLFPQRMMAAVTAIFGGLALGLTAIGLYGLTAYSVSERTRELGVRMALGATRRDIMRLVLGQGLRLVFAGISCGLVVALALTRHLGSFLFEVSATEPTTFAGTVLVLAAVALSACYLPARRAARGDVLAALRYE